MKRLWALSTSRRVRIGLVLTALALGGLVAGGVQDVGAPGGGIVAVARCNAADSACLDPNAKHDFASFTVSHPPLSASWPLRLQATFGGRLLYVSNANCGLFTFNVVNGRWYGHAPA